MDSIIRQSLTPDIVLLTLKDESAENALTVQMSKDFWHHIQYLRNNPPRAIILTGHGDTFSTGRDWRLLLDLRNQKDAQIRALVVRDFVSSFLALLDIGVPVIAALNGDAVGPGFYLSCACDFRVARAGASFGAESLRYGLFPTMGSTYFLPKLLGHARAYQLMSGGRISAEEGYRLGFIHEVVPAPEVIFKAKELALQLANTAPEVSREVLRSIRGNPERLKAAMTEESKGRARSVYLREFAEGMRADQGGRTPTWLRPETP